MEIQESNFADSVSRRTTSTQADVEVNAAALAAVVMTSAVDVEVAREAEARTDLSSMRIPSRLSEADSPAKAATKVNFKSLDCSHAFRCDE